MSFRETLEKHANIILGIILCLSIILNIVLLCTPLYKGTYTATINNDANPEYNYTKKLRIYDNTYTITTIQDNKYIGLESGFYTYMPKSKYQQSLTSITLDTDCVVLESSDSSSTLFYRHSVFKLSYKSGNKTINFYCGFAIFLQVIHCVIFIGAIILLIYFNKA